MTVPRACGDRPRAREGVGMPPIKQAAEEFLSHQRVAVTGVSRDPSNHGGNVLLM